MRKESIRFKVLVLACLVFVVIFCFGYERTIAKPKAIETLNIGVVSIRRIFEDCKRNAGYRQQMSAEQEKMMAELEKLAKEIEAQQAGLKTLKADSEDYLVRTKDLIQKRAGLEAQQEFFKRQIEMKDQRWTERLYKDILDKTGEVAEQKGLALVVESSSPEMPSLSVNELMLTVRTHKVLFDDGCVDITEEVMSLVDAVK